MRKVLYKSVTDHVARKLAAVVYQKNANGELEATFRSRLRTVTAPTVSQQAARDRFREATRYAKRALLDEVLRPIYRAVAKEHDQLPRAMAVSDWFNPPVVRRFILDRYQGRIGDLIEVDATDDIAVASVEVIVRLDSSGAEIERGMAMLADGRWLYTATAPLAPEEIVTSRRSPRTTRATKGGSSSPFNAEVTS